MLIEFSVKNFKSIADKQSFTMSASDNAAKNEDKHFTLTTEHNNAPYVWPTSCILGANGAGKTNLIAAIRFFEKFIRTSTNVTQEKSNNSTGVTPHLFNRQYKDAPSEFEIVFIDNNILYQYGFILDARRIYEEWLYATPNDAKTRRRELFYRNYDAQRDEYDYRINHIFVRGRKKLWRDTTRHNVLFLSQAQQLDAPSFEPVYNWINDKLWYVGNTDSMDRADTIDIWQNSPDHQHRILKFLQVADTYINNISIRDVEGNFEFSEGTPEHIQKFIINEKRPIKTMHHTIDGDMVELDLKEESNGTQTLFKLAALWLEMLDEGKCLFIDELHNNLHPHMLKFLVELFQNPSININKAQLIFTSHSNSITMDDFMHKEQIWLAEKSKAQATQYISLSDFNIRAGTNISRAYSHGRYGGIPNIGNIADIAPHG